MRTKTPAKKTRRATPRVRSSLEFHVHPSLVQVHDGKEETPLALLQSPRGDSAALLILASGVASAIGAKLRRFDATGKES